MNDADVPDDEKLTEGERLILEGLKSIDTRMRSIDSKLAARPTRDEVAGRRRATALGLVGVIVLTVFAFDGAAVNCTEGERAGRVLDEILHPDVSLDSVRDVATEPRPAACDVALPVRAHSPGETWPTWPNVAGLVLYVAAFTAAVVWASGPSRRRRSVQDSAHPRRRSTDYEQLA